MSPFLFFGYLLFVGLYWKGNCCTRLGAHFSFITHYLVKETENTLVVDRQLWIILAVEGRNGLLYGYLLPIFFLEPNRANSAVSEAGRGRGFSPAP